jgi:acetyl esterase/lipase
MSKPTWMRTFVLLAIVLEVPVLARLVRAVTREPVVEELAIDGVPVELVRPRGTGPWPSWVFVSGAHPERRREPVVGRVSRGLARAGFVVFVPDLPGLGEGEISLRTLEAGSAVVEAAVTHVDTRGGRTALAGASVGGGLGVLIAARSRHSARVSVVAAVSPYADLHRILMLATTSHYSDGNVTTRVEPTALMRRVVARSVIAALPAGDDRTALLEQLRRLERDDQDAIDGLSFDGFEPGEGARRTVELLQNTDPAAFASCLERLPIEARDLVNALSPERHALAVHAPVIIIAPPNDPYFPLQEPKILAETTPQGTLTVTGALDHTRPGLARLGAFVAFLRWTRCCLHLAASR